jgi:hypothetical protein
MITFTEGNLLEARAEALVNTVNTVGVMGKGIALMFKERFDRELPPIRRRLQGQAGADRARCSSRDVHELDGAALDRQLPHQAALAQPLAHGMGGGRPARPAPLPGSGTSEVRGHSAAGRRQWWAGLGAGAPQIEAALGDLDIEIMVFEPTRQYQNVAKRAGVEKLTPARALIAELVRRYWVLGMECSLLEIQKLAWFLERSIERVSPEHNPLS